jgi:hypothetical protein
MHYSVTEFRKNIREILDKADRGEEVLIQRYDRLYAIKPTVRGDSALPAVHEPMQKAMEKTAEKKSRLTRPEKIEVSVRARRAGKTEAIAENAKKGKIEIALDPCPHGYAKGMCKHADCNRKYAK